MRALPENILKNFDVDDLLSLTDDSRLLRRVNEGNDMQEKIIKIAMFSHIIKVKFQFLF